MGSNQVRFDDRVLLVTGGGRGLGRSHALLLASRGAKVVVADSGVEVSGAGGSASVAEAVVEEIQRTGGQAAACSADLSTEVGSTGAIESCLSSFGRIDAIIHNASTVPAPAQPQDLSSEDFDLCMRVNAYAGFWLTRTAWPHMADQNYGRIVYTTSGAIFGSAGGVAYAAAKSAYIGMMKSFAVQGAPLGIYANALAPSARTRMTEGVRSSPYMDWLLSTMVPEKVSIGAAYLLSEACEIFGETLSFEGGHMSRIALAENEGVLGAGESIEEIRDAVSQVIADTRYTYPQDMKARMLWSAELFGLDESVGAKQAWS